MKSLLLASALLLASCGDDPVAPNTGAPFEGPAVATGEARVVAPPVAVSDPATASPAAASPPPVAIAAGRVRATLKAEDGATGAALLSWTASGVLQGEVTLGGTKYIVSGLVAGNELRGWLAAGTSEQPRRGFLVATLAGATGEGTFAVAANGGDSPTTGAIQLAGQ